MSSHTPAGGAGAASSIAPASTNNRRIIPLEIIPFINGKLLWFKERRDVIVNLLTVLHKSFYDNLFTNTLKIHLEMDTDNLFKYYMKGGNAITLLTALTSSLEHIIFPSDFDYSLLINPELPLDRYNAIQASVVGNCLYNLQLFCNNRANWAPFLELLPEEYNTTPNRVIISSRDPVHFDNNGKIINKSHEIHPNIHLNRILDTVKHWVLSPDCPFLLLIIPNMILPGSADTLLNIGVIKLLLRNSTPRNKHTKPTDEYTELYNMTFLLRNEETESNSYKKLKRDWDITQLVLYDKTIPKTKTQLLSYLYDPLTAYINQKIAFNANTRSNKRSKRSVRMTHLKHMLTNTRRNGNARNTRKRSIRNRYPEFSGILTNNI